MIERAYAKLNLSLDVLGKMDDGYHDLRMVMQSVEFGDDLELELTGDGSFLMTSGRSYLPCDDRNLSMRAAKLFLEGTGLGVRIRTVKRTPLCAGMAGGSADAAAVLRGLTKLTGAKRSYEELCELGLRIGSDVPFCIRGGTALAGGRGEMLTPLAPLSDCPIVICKPEFAISTPELFGKIDARKSRIRPDTPGILFALEKRDLPGVARRMYNVFEDVLTRREDDIFSIKSELLSRGALGAAMTGTGSAVFGLFAEEAAAKNAYETLAAQYKECYLTRPVGQAEIA